MGTQQQGGASAGAGGAKPGMRKPVFTKVDQLKPGTNGHTLTVNVVSSKTVLQKGRAASSHLRQTRIAECLIGDETGTIVFTARNEQGPYIRTYLRTYILIALMYTACFESVYTRRNPNPRFFLFENGAIRTLIFIQFRNIRRLLSYLCLLFSSLIWNS